MIRGIGMCLPGSKEFPQCDRQIHIRPLVFDPACSLMWHVVRPALDDSMPEAGEYAGSPSVSLRTQFLLEMCRAATTLPIATSLHADDLQKRRTDTISWRILRMSHGRS